MRGVMMDDADASEGGVGGIPHYQSSMSVSYEWLSLAQVHVTFAVIKEQMTIYGSGALVGVSCFLAEP